VSTTLWGLPDSPCVLPHCITPTAAEEVAWDLHSFPSSKGTQRMSFMQSGSSFHIRPPPLLLSVHFIGCLLANLSHLQPLPRFKHAGCCGKTVVDKGRRGTNRNVTKIVLPRGMGIGVRGVTVQVKRTNCSRNSPVPPHLGDTIGCSETFELGF
jgi:hypothetical protein